MIQGGDPLGEGYAANRLGAENLIDEINRSSPLYQAAMKRNGGNGNAGPDTNGSQFFIMHVDQFCRRAIKIRRVIEGQNVLTQFRSQVNERDKTTRKSRNSGFNRRLVINGQCMSG